MAIIDVNEGDYVLALWFVGNEDGDQLVCVRRNAGQPDDSWELIVRFRYRIDDDHGPTTSEDTKRVMVGDASGKTEREMLEAGDHIAAIAEIFYQNPAERVMVRGGPRRLAERLVGRPWASVYGLGQA